MKYVLILYLINLAAVASESLSCFGCIHVVTGANLRKSEEVLNKSLDKLAAGSGPYYQLVQINSATRQVGVTTKHEINADLKDRKYSYSIKTCDVEILSRTWLSNDVQVTFYCPGQLKLVKVHSAL